jgi:hypothetical protein
MSEGTAVPTNGPSTGQTEGQPRGKLTAFRVLAGIGAVFLGGFTLFFAIATWVGADDQQIHALHNSVGVAVYLPLFVVPLVAAIRDPGGTVALFRLAVVGSIAVVVAGVIGGTIISVVVTFVVVLALLWLHPARADVLRLGALDVPLLAIVAIAAIPGVAYGLDQADLQASRPAEDPHVPLEHYAGMAGAAFGFVLAGAVAAFDGRGARIARWLVGLGGAALAALFLAYPDHASAIDREWAVAVLAISVVYVAVAEIRARRPA